MLLYPDQLGDPQDLITFTEPRHTVDSKTYEAVSKRIYKWFKNDKD